MLTKGIPWKKLFIFALPLMLANMLQQLYNTADTIIVGNFVSQKALAAVGSCTYLTGLYTGISIALALGVGVIVSQCYGAKNNENLRKSAGSGILLMSLIGLLFSIFSFFSCKFFLTSIISVPPEILNQSVVYAKIYSVGLFFQFCYNVFSSILRGIGNSKSSLYFLIITTIINVILDLFLVCIFHLGVKGVAVATCFSQAIAMIVSYFYMINKYPIFKPKWIFDKNFCIDSLKTGLPLAIQALIVNGGFMIMQSLANSFGVEMTASYAVSCRLEIYMLIPIISMLHSISTFAGQNFGAKKLLRLQIGIKQAVIMNLIIATCIGFFFFSLAPKLISLFAIEGQAYKYALSHVRLASIDLLLYASYTPVNGMCIGIGKSFVLSIISFVELSGRILFTLILSHFIGTACIWWSEPFAWFIVVVGVYWYYNRVLRMLKV